jgi:hypothetical protein
MANTDKTPCECSKFDAVDSGQLTEANLESGDYETFDTGCQAETGRTFAPGHDARLKSHLIKWGSQGLEVARMEGGMRVSSDAQDWANKYGFGHMVSAGIAKATEKAKAKATRNAARAAKKTASAERNLAKAAGVITADEDTTHDGNAARKAREAKGLAEIVAAEEAAHAEAERASRPEPEWDDSDTNTVDLTGKPEVIAKVGRWEYKGVVADNGTLYYLAKDGHTRKEAVSGKFVVVREI